VIKKFSLQSGPYPSVLTRSLNRSTITMSTWSPQAEGLTDLVGLLHQSSSGDTKTQDQVIQVSYVDVQMEELNVYPFAASKFLRIDPRLSLLFGSHSFKPTLRTSHSQNSRRNPFEERNIFQVNLRFSKLPPSGNLELYQVSNFHPSLRRTATREKCGWNRD
jgi:hypothetical protein